MIASRGQRRMTARRATTRPTEKHMACESVRPVTCSACGSLFDRQAWMLLVLVERIEPAKVRRMLLR
jgi:hypothetical protein